MTQRTQATSYRPTESKYKGSAEEMYVTYDKEMSDERKATLG